MAGLLRHGTLALVGLSVGATAIARGDDGAPPRGYDRVETSDLTFTLRDDDFASISPDPDDAKTAYVGTFQGRFYRTDDGGHTWTEGTVIPEQRLLWQAPGATIFFGGVRSAGGGLSTPDLIGRTGSPLAFAHVPSTLPRLPTSEIPSDPLADETAISAAGGAANLGVGLSARSPRLSLLTAVRGRGAATLNRARFLSEHILRGTAVYGVTPSPSDRRILFAVTQNGLYKSYDGGESWSRSFAGLTASERTATRIAVRPGNPELWLLGTTNGAYTSTDGGDNWSKITTVGGVVFDVAFDAKDPKLIYLATNGGLMRSNDGGATYIPIYYSTMPAEGDVRSIVIDPFDPNTGYIGTMRGAFVTHNLRTAQLGDWAPLEGVQSILAVPQLGACDKHKGHIYALTRMDLATINYGADAPESAILESWDGGHTWRQIFTGQTDGTVLSFGTDVKNPDALWIAWSKGLHRLERAQGDRNRGEDITFEPGELGPNIGDVVLAALRYEGLELNNYVDYVHLPKFASLFLPRRLTVTGSLLNWSVGGRLDDNTFAPQRYLQAGSSTEWAVTVWASWSLPSLVYNADTVPLLRQRVNILNDELRRRITESVRRSYGELQRIQALLDNTKLDLETRVTYRLRIDMLAAIVDLESGGYLSRWQKQHRRKQTR